MADNIGDRFQKETKYNRHSMPSGSIDWDKKPAIYKEYPESEKIDLLRPAACGDMTLYEAILGRKSSRRFVNTSLTKDTLSCLVWASSGMQRKETGFEFRTAPSAGALYPIETYMVIHNVQDIDQGVYHYHSRYHCLERLEKGDLRDETAKAALGQRMCANAAAVIIWTAIFEKSKWKYKQRAYRYIYLDAGHMAQNLGLASTSIGIGCCHVGSFFDDEVNRIIGVDGIHESAVYMSVIGHTGVMV